VSANRLVTAAKETRKGSADRMVAAGGGATGSCFWMVARPLIVANDQWTE
jgi:hypothetical protein